MNESVKLILAICAVLALTSCNAFVDADEAGAFECDVYCNIMMEGCDETFSDIERCYDACEGYPSVPEFEDNGEPRQLGQRVDNADSFECRIYHGQTALEVVDGGAEENNFHCVEAAPLGGGTCSDASRDCASLCFDKVSTCDPIPTKEVLVDCEERCDRELEEGGPAESNVRFQCRRQALDNAMTAKEMDKPAAQKSFCDAAQSNMPCTDLGVLNRALEMSEND